VGSAGCNGRYCITAGNRGQKWALCRHREQGRAGLRVAASRRDPVPSKAGYARNGPGRSGPERCARDRSACGSLGRVRSRPPVARPGSAVRIFNTCDGGKVTTVRVAVQTGWNRDTEILQSGFERVVGRVWVCSRLSWIFGALFFCEGLRSWSGLGSVGVGGPPRVDPCDALPRPVPRPSQAGLSGAHAAPALASVPSRNGASAHLPT
jgi:hypothetical protein